MTPLWVDAKDGVLGEVLDCFLGWIASGKPTSEN